MRIQATIAAALLGGGLGVHSSNAQEPRSLAESTLPSITIAESSRRIDWEVEGVSLKRARAALAPLAKSVYGKVTISLESGRLAAGLKEEALHLNDVILTAPLDIRREFNSLSQALALFDAAMRPQLVVGRFQAEPSGYEDVSYSESAATVNAASRQLHAAIQSVPSVIEGQGNKVRLTERAAELQNALRINFDLPSPRDIAAESRKAAETLAVQSALQQIRTQYSDHSCRAILVVEEMAKGRAIAPLLEFLKIECAGSKVTRSGYRDLVARLENAQIPILDAEILSDATSADVVSIISCGDFSKLPLRNRVSIFRELDFKARAEDGWRYCSAKTALMDGSTLSKVDAAFKQICSDGRNENLQVFKNTLGKLSATLDQSGIIKASRAYSEYFK